MPYDVSQGFPSIVPQLSYRDVGAALDWLSDTFGFREVLRVPEPDGTVRWGEMSFEDGYLMLGLAERAETTSRSHTIVFVRDVLHHHSRVSAVTDFAITTPDLKPEGLLEYTTADLEGQRWTFSQHVRDVPATAWGAVPASSV